MTSATSIVAAQIVIVTNWVRASKASAPLSSVAGPSSSIAFHWNSASPPATNAVNAVSHA